MSDMTPTEVEAAFHEAEMERYETRQALRRVLALADEFDAQVPWPHSWIGNRIREAAGTGHDQGAGE